MRNYMLWIGSDCMNTQVENANRFGFNSNSQFQSLSPNIV